MDFCRCELVTDPFVRVDRQKRFIYANEAACRVLGKAREELLGMEFPRFLHKDDIKHTFDRLKMLMNPPYRMRFENRVKTTGGLRWFEWEVCGLLDEQGRVVEIQGFGRANRRGERNGQGNGRKSYP